MVTMRHYTLLIDGGTTHTRFMLVKDNIILDRSRQAVGAADGSEAVCAVVREAIKEFEQKHHARVSVAVASGMITSGRGIKEIPHIDAPSTFEDLLSNTRPYRIDHVSKDIDFYLVPGIKTQKTGGKVAGMDVMRGEETEVFAAVGTEDTDQSILLIHAGSHVKGILYQNKAIMESVTTLSGEMFWAIGRHTILKNDLISHQDQNRHIAPDAGFVREGYWACRKEGFTRSLFMIRLMGLQGRGAAQLISFLYGVLICSDLEAFSSMLSVDADKLILYGREPYTAAMRICLEAFCDRHVGLSVISYEESEALSGKTLLEIARRLIY